MSAALDDLDAEQRAAAEALGGPVGIIAGAGTGKTRTVTHRLAHGILTGAVDPRRALAVTHSRKAAAELGERLAALGATTVDALTFHATGLRIAKRWWAATGRPEPGPSVLSDSEGWRLWRDSLRAVTRGEPDNGDVRDLIEEVGWARSRRVAAEDYDTAAQLADRDPGIDGDTVRAAWARFESGKARLGKVDFADLLDLAAGLIEGDDSIGAAVRDWWVHLTVDEYQDTDPAQQRLLDAILGDGRDICVVGDPRQAIYSWKGGDVRYLNGFARRYPDARVFDLTRNYRSTPQILDWANRVAGGGRTRPLVATRPRGRPPKVTALAREAGEAAWVAGAARRAIEDGTPATEIAVLYRFNAAQARFEAAFARAGIATVVAEDSTFFDRPEVRAVLVPFGRAARAQPDADGLELLTSVLAGAGFDPDRPPSGLGAARARWESHQALLELVEAAPAEVRADARSLLAEINSLAVRTHGPRTGGVTLATLHRAKGLEWDVVFVVGATDGAIPSSYATSPEERAEEERLLHVGITRARHELHLTWAESNARGWTNRASPYIDRLGSGSGAAAPTGARTGARTRRDSRRQDTRRRDTADPGAGAQRGAARGRPSSADCPHCAEPLKGPAARRVGICSRCVTTAGGAVGVRARALADLAADAAQDSGEDRDVLVTASGLLRLLDARPTTAAEVAGTTGVGLRGRWAQAAADILAP